MVLKPFGFLFLFLLLSIFFLSSSFIPVNLYQRLGVIWTYCKKQDGRKESRMNHRLGTSSSV